MFAFGFSFSKEVKIMMNLNFEEKKSSFKLLAILLLVYVGIQMLSMLGGYSTFLSWVNVLSYAAMGIILLVKNIDKKYIVIPLGIVTLVSAYSLISMLGYVGYVRGFVNLLSNLLELAAFGIITFYAVNLWRKIDVPVLFKYWYLPAICGAVSLVINFIGGFLWSAFLLELLSLPMSILFIAILFLFGKCFSPEAKSKKTTGSNVNKSAVSSGVIANVTDEEGYCDMVKHVLLLLFTCGIWNYIWIYRVTKYLNITPGEEYRDPTNKLLLCIFVPFYNIYWVYQSARRIDVLARSKGVASDIGTLSLIMALFVPIVAPIIMQSKINQVCTSDGNVGSSTSVNNKVNVGIADELKKYKELLDDGAITEEEYEAKKKQLLGL